MSEKFKIIEYKNHKICYSNYTELKDEEYVEQIHKNTKSVIDESKKQGKLVLILVNVSGTFGTDDVMEAFKVTAKEVKPYTKKSAIIGITGIQKVLLNAVNLFSSMSTKAFQSEEEACEWLIKD